MSRMAGNGASLQAVLSGHLSSGALAAPRYPKFNLLAQELSPRSAIGELVERP